MKALKKLDRKLNWYQKIKKTVLITGLAAGLLIPSGVAGVPFLIEANQKWEQEKALHDLVREPVSESFIADVKKKSLDLFVEDGYNFKEKDGVWSYTDTGSYKEFEAVIKNVSESTGVPRYILAAMVDYCSQCGSSPMGGYDWSGRTPITPEEVGVKGLVLWKDPEQDFLSAAGKFKRIMQEVQDEEVALALMFTQQDTVKKAKSEAATAYARLTEYGEWRSKRSAEELARYDVLVEQRNATPMREWDKRSELEAQLKILFDEITTEKSTGSGDVRGNWEAGKRTWHPDLFKVTIYPQYWKYTCWWANNLSMGGTAVKIAERLKRDGFQ